MIKIIVDGVTAEIAKRLKKEMHGIEAKLDDIDRRLKNMEAYVELRDMVRDFDFLLSKHSTDVADILNPDDTLHNTLQRRPGL